jgi:hypothetical protein
LIFLRRACHGISILALTACASALVHSQDAKPRETVGAKPGADKSNQQQTQPPITVTLTAPKPSTEELEAERKTSERQEAINARVAEANVSIAYWTTWLVIVGAAQIGASLLAFWVGWRAANAAKQAANAAKDSAETASHALLAAQRPFLMVQEVDTLRLMEGEPWHMAKPWDSGDTLKQVGVTFVIRWKNFGSTPAVDVQGRFEVKKIKLGEPSDFELLPIKPSAPVTFVAPQASVGTPTGAELTWDEINALALGELTVYVYGRMQYRDTFPDTPIHYTDVCARVTVTDNPRSTVKAFTFPMHDKHNRAN